MLRSKKMQEVVNSEKKYTWVDAETAHSMFNVTMRTIKNWCKTDKIDYTVTKNGNKTTYFVNVDSIKKFKELSKSAKPRKNYSDAPNWAKVQADKYLPLIKATESMRGNKLRNFIDEYNSKNIDNPISYSSMVKMRKRYNDYGIDGLLANYGYDYGKSIVDDIDYQYFKSVYLIEGSPSLRTCWNQTLGNALKNNAELDKSIFPSQMAFLRRLKKELPPQAIYLARNGKSAFNRKFGNYVERDYSYVKCGEVWVSDHAQIDVAVFDEENNVVFPWVTCWRDYKSGKWLGWTLQCGSPNSDRIFQAFYYAALRYGLPKDVIIDNGKDYRCKDFAGGRVRTLENIKIETDKKKSTSMLDTLNVNVHFALPYNAQTKPIERDFLRFKNAVSKHSVGYRGGNVVERPEKLKSEIKANKIYTFKEFKRIFDRYILLAFNKQPLTGKNHKGLTADEFFNKEFTKKITPTQDALKLFCMRTSHNYTIARNGIKDRKLEITYWADWMISKMTTKVYMRRDPQNYKDAWVFDATNDEFLGKCKAVKAIPALYANEISKKAFEEALANKKRSYKITKAYLDNLDDISLEEKCENYIRAFAKKEKEHKPKVSIIANTPMDQAIRKSKEMDAFGKNDLTMFMPEDKPKEDDLYLFETDRLLDEELKGVANGRY